MTYTPPSVGSIDLTGSAGAYTEPALGSIDLTGAPVGDPDGTLSASLGFTADMIGAMYPIGSVSADLGFSAELSGPGSFLGSIDAALGFSASGSGNTATVFGQITSSAELSFSGTGFQDWTSALAPVQIQEFYSLEITGSPSLVVKISSWQATMNVGARSSYLQAVIPAAAGLIEEIESRQNGKLILSKGFRFDDGSERSEPILETDFDNFRYDRGSSQFTVTVSGYIKGAQSQSGSRELKEIRSINLTNGNFRVRAGIDMFLRPGMNAVALGESFKVRTINFYASQADRFCEVSQ